MKLNCLLVLFLLVLINYSHTYKLIRFSGGGIFFFWQVGAAAYIQEHCDDLRCLPVQGASAGSIAATMLATQASFHDIAELSIQIAQDNRVWDNKFGLLGIWGPLIEQFLEELIPNDLDKDTLSRINILITPSLVVRGPKLVSNFDGKRDLINAIMASIHIPLLMNKKPWAAYKGKNYIDGGFWSYIANVQGPWPLESLDVELDVLQVDQGRDVVFMSQLEDRNIMKLISPETVYEMMQRGYDYMDDMSTKGLLSSSELSLPRKRVIAPRGRLSF